MTVTSSRRPVIPPGTPRRDAILKVASRLLRERELDVSLQDIADELGVTYNALYNHFKNRDDLLYLCLLRHEVMLFDCLAKCHDRGGTGLLQIMSFLREFIDLSIREGLPPPRLTVALSHDAQVAMLRHARPSRSLMATIFEQGLHDGSIAISDPEITIHWILHTIYWWPDELKRRRAFNDVRDTILDRIERAIRA